MATSLACYNPLTNFSFLPSSGPPSTQPAAPPPQPISIAPAPAPPAQPTSSSQPAPLAFNPFLTSHLPLYDVTDFYEHPQGYAQLQQPLGSLHRQPLPPSPDPNAEMSSPTHANSSIDHYGLLQPPSPRDDPMLRTAPRDCMTELESGCSGSVTCTRGSIPRITCMRPVGLFRRIFGEYSVSPRPPYNPFSYPVCGVRLLTVKPLFHLS